MTAMNGSDRTREHRVSYYQMTYIEMYRLIPSNDRALFNQRLRGLLYQYLPIKHFPRVIDELSRAYPQLKKLIPKRR